MILSVGAVTKSGAASTANTDTPATGPNASKVGTGSDNQIAKQSADTSAPCSSSGQLRKHRWALDISIIIADETYFRAFCIAHSAF